MFQFHYTKSHCRIGTSGPPTASPTVLLTLSGFEEHICIAHAGFAPAQNDSASLAIFWMVSALQFLALAPDLRPLLAGAPTGGSIHTPVN
jgi:hypothetical protein